ncbi:hypothetical protein Aple_059800 [Acrocarpospora pleiomorpha]|uniref:Uncharacterized protein n=1 Tax=Acrocarpospora pleiomorpha TaxID=90975 RepID=A0A5M3XUA3_9ACTN|nr:hypothetical protein [Acrocarpospora pleiomorpha]GES23081.1 hypothetical protein Aple_059800 [Acrocarpospora pleiomorpha]
MGPTLGQWPDMRTTPGMGSPPAGPAQTQCAAALQRLYGWLQAVLPQAPQYTGAVPLAVEAVRLYRNGHYDACLAQIQQVADFIGRGGQPYLPPQ